MLKYPCPFSIPPPSLSLHDTTQHDSTPTSIAERPAQTPTPTPKRAVLHPFRQKKNPKRPGLKGRGLMGKREGGGACFFSLLFLSSSFFFILFSSSSSSFCGWRRRGFFFSLFFPAECLQGPDRSGPEKKHDEFLFLPPSGGGTKRASGWNGMIEDRTAWDLRGYGMR